MADRQITASGKDKDGDITKLCKAGEAWSPRQKADAIRDIVELIRSAETTFQTVHVLVEGYADSSGTPELNVRLSRERAEAVMNLLITEGVPARLVRTVGRGALISSEGDSEGSSENPGGKRKVGFVVEVESLSDREE